MAPWHTEAPNQATLSLCYLDEPAEPLLLYELDTVVKRMQSSCKRHARGRNEVRKRKIEIKEAVNTIDHTEVLMHPLNRSQGSQNQVTDAS